MRILLLIAALLPIAAAAYFGSVFLAELDERTTLRDAERRQDWRGVGQALAATGYEFEQLVLGPGRSPDERQFRARVVGGGGAQSAYGVIDRSCAGPNGAPDVDPGGADTGPEAAGTSEAAGTGDCWRLAALYVDGDEVDATAGPAAPAAAAIPTGLTANLTANEPTDAAPVAAPAAVSTLDQAAAAPDEPSPDGDADLAGPAALPAIRPQPEPAPDLETAAAAPQAAERPSHEVKLSLVNARDAPTLQGGVRTQLEQGTPLLLLETDGRWGRFRVLNGQDRGVEIWIAFSVLSSI